ncbi:hypothetical protein CHS0354_035722 [Potamilus streckersoni]|uniref:C-type lectin domain-containing protein n=1 Tax=Potamilus streckersoni TaxID=2493646 RepID=A0AAE0S093_9BIVA|nr:hypothetical protein CHS0354_035722 [Potamilus streckersoni]
MIRYSLAYIWLLGIIGQRKVFVNPFLLDAERCQLKTPTTYSHGDFCYEFYLGTEVYWHDAKTACEHQGGYLATIDSMNVQNFVMDRLKDLGFSHNGIWIGLNDEAEELHWRWADGTPLGSFQYWGSGESNQFLTHFLEDCVHLRYTDGGRWHDSPCDSLTYKYNYICQSNILPTRAATLMRTTASTLRTATTKVTTATKTTTQQRTQKLSSTPEQEYTETAPNMQTSTTRIPRMPTDTSENVVTSAESTSGTAFLTAPTTTHTDTTTLEKETTTTLGPTLTMKTTTTTTAKSDKETTTTQISTSGPITSSAMKTTVKQEKETTMTPISTTSWPITISTVKKTTSKPTTSTTMKLTINTAMAHTSTTISSPVTTKTSTTSPTTMKSTMNTATTTMSTTQLTTGREIDPCTGFTCNLDCGILGYVFGANGCPECACAT